MNNVLAGLVHSACSYQTRVHRTARAGVELIKSYSGRSKFCTYSWRILIERIVSRSENDNSTGGNASETGRVFHKNSGACAMCYLLL